MFHKMRKEFEKRLAEQIMKGNISAIRKVIFINRCLGKIGRLINYEYKSGDMLLHIAAKYNKSKVIKFILDEGADINYTTNEGETALSIALREGHNEVAMILLERGAETAGLEGSFAIVCKELKHQIALSKMKLLIENLINNKTKFTQAMPELRKLILNESIDINMRNKRGLSLLHIAVLNGTVKNVENLLDLGADINVRDKFRFTLLHIAAKKNKLDIIKLLLYKGIDYRRRDISGATFMDILCEQHIFSVEKVMRYIKAVENKGISKVLEEINDMKDMVELYPTIEKLILKKEDINLQGEGGMTLLHWAAAHKNVAIMKKLIKLGAKHEIEDDQGKTCLQYLGERESASVLEIKSFIRQNKIYNMFTCMGENGMFGLCAINLEI